ncbi:hypothetical protein FNF29_00111 [Cafeteria roenbergensis]|uniref:Uncharacterized protein n=1 Tax=Cafeteria roenbergensis TaxID=33653 RepID=A0A5A8CX54_CAFRO|nr:hypothetical protein FNF29_00111 [Cafeteria roenbergensis]|eukprot:KAA0157535.1 hypothetical protein FNF29_00111 [Cafeteria roenbergensis]
MAAAAASGALGEADGWPTTASAYKLGGVIGQGAFAKVYRAECTSRSETVAVKIIELDKVQTPIEVIMNEVRAMALCHHENVLPLHAAFVSGSDLWLVSPLMSKGSAFWLVRMLNRDSPTRTPPFIPEPAIKAIMSQALHGLAYLHSQKQIHRDIKAGNILIGAAGEVMIGDFGVAGWMADGLSREDGRRDTFVGTPCWMAPEVMEQSKGYNERADIWSLGITALELTMGKAPYASLPPMQVLLETLNKDPPTLESYRSGDVEVPKMSADFHKFVARCLCRNPTKRPSATELLSDRFIRTAKLEDLVALLPDVGEVGPDTAAALSDKPGYEAAGMVRPADSKFAEGTTWVLWKGSGSVTISAGAEVQPSAVSDDMFEAALSSMAQGRPYPCGAACTSAPMSLDAKAPSFRIKAGLLVPSEVEGSGGRRFRVTADPRRGYLEITANQDEGTLSIGWRTRNAQDTEFSLIIMADSLRVARVATGRDGDRVYSLISKGSSSRRFFWLQEPDADGDEARIRRLRAMLKSPPQVRAPGMGALAGGMGMMQAMAAASRAARGGASPDPHASASELLQRQLQGLDPAARQRVMQALQAARPGGAASVDAPGRGAPPSSASPGMMPGASSIGGPGGEAAAPASRAEVPAGGSAASHAASSSAAATAGSAGDGGAGGAGGDPSADAAHALVMQAMLAQARAQAEAPRTAPLPLVLNTSDALDVATGSDEAAERLIRRLPESQRSREQLEAAIRSPQLRQALSALSAALGTENYETVFANFDLDPADGADELAHGDAVGAFLAALRAKVSRADGAGPAGDEGDSAGTDDADEEGDHGEAE